MDTRLLKLFIAVARHNSLVGAAKDLHLTPSALSHGLKDLETGLGCRLFDRVGKRLALNQAGEHLLDKIEKPLAQIEQASASVKALKQWGQTRLRVGASAMACEHILPPVFRELLKDYPKLSIQVESGGTDRLLGLLREQRIELALCVLPERLPDLEGKPLCEDELLFVIAPSHPWAAGQPLSNEDISRQIWITDQRSSVTTRLVSRYFEDHNAEPACVTEIANVAAIKEMVKLNLGVAVLAPWAVERELTRGQLKMRPLGPKPLKRQWIIGHLSAKRLSLAEEKFCKLCRRQAAALRLDRKDLPEAARVRLR